MTNDNMAMAVDWLDAYRGKSLDIVDMYDAGAALECRCSGDMLVGTAAVEKYWSKRFTFAPALDLVDLQMKDGGALAVTYRTPTAIVTAILGFDDASGKIAWQRCGPEAAVAVEVECDAANAQAAAATSYVPDRGGTCVR